MMSLQQMMPVEGISNYMIYFVIYSHSKAFSWGLYFIKKIGRSAHRVSM